MAARSDLTSQFQEVLSQLERGASDKKRDKNRILKKSSKKDGFERRAREIVSTVQALNAFLLEHRANYMDLLGQKIGISAMNDRQRDKIDAGANHFIRTANQLIAKFKADLGSVKETFNASRVQHLDHVTQILERYLKHVCDLYAEQKAIRVQRELEFQKMSRLEVRARKSESSHGRPLFLTFFYSFCHFRK